MAKIGVFDSGLGGLSILRDLTRILPEYDYIYLGDNARAPYGTRSFESVYAYTWQCVNRLFAEGCELIVLACNTASAKALRSIQQRELLDVWSREGNQSKRVLGVIRPTVEVVPSLTQNGHIGILATPGTVASMSYVAELEKQPLSPHYSQFAITQQACPLWVSLIEAGEHLNEGADYFVEKYLRALLSQDPLVDTILLGCTHYPLLQPKIEACLARLQEEFAPLRVEDADIATDAHTNASSINVPIRVVAQGEIVARSLADYLQRHADLASMLERNGSRRYLTTDSAQRFSASATLFLGSPVSAEKISL